MKTGRLLLYCLSSHLLFKQCISYVSKPAPISIRTIASCSPIDSNNSDPNDPLRNRAIWQSQWEKIEAMRAQHRAAVDTMGAGALARRGLPVDDREFRFQTLIATMLSPQTRDEQTSLAFDNLVNLVKPDPLIPKSLLRFSVEEIENAIKPVSFYSAKAPNILEASRNCVELYDDDIPTDIDDLLKFRGVGPKIAYLTFTIARGITLGICVDTHVHRISNRLGWVDTWTAKSNGPERTRKQLESFLPKDYWEDVNGLIVGFGQSICSARGPNCAACALTDSCKYYNDNNFMRK